MVDAQNERTKGRDRRQRRRRQRGSKQTPVENEQHVHQTEPTPKLAPAPPAPVIAAPVIRPDNIASPTVRSEEYCIRHMANFTECEPMQTRSGMTTVRHLRVDQFGEATLYCDCLHNGPHEWPPSTQILQTAIELDQFLAASTKDE